MSILANETISEQIRKVWAVTDEYGDPVPGDAVGVSQFPLEHAVDLAQYHPKNLHLHRFAHAYRMAFTMIKNSDGSNLLDDQGYPILGVGATGDRWPSNLRQGLFDKLRLRVKTITNDELLSVEDSEIQFETGNWKVVNYRSTLSRDEVGNGVFVDELRWLKQDSGKFHDSRWSWKIYRHQSDEHQQFFKSVLNEWAE